jgi:hypothetical protein
VFVATVRHGELLVLGVKVAASTVWEILNDAGIRVVLTGADAQDERGDGTVGADLPP